MHPKQDIKQVIKKLAKRMYPISRSLEERIHALNSCVAPVIFNLREPITIDDIKSRSLRYISNMRICQGHRFVGYRHSASTKKPVLYATLAALLLKHLYGEGSECDNEELNIIQRFQSGDGLFRDPVISCKSAETEDWWGWRHLTLHALMTFALYNVPANKELLYLRRFKDKDTFRTCLNSRDWGARAAWTSNEIQNVGVMLQYARDYQNSERASTLLEVLYDVVDAHQDQETGLFGLSFDTPVELSLGVQAGYHLWLLYFYDRRPIRRIERIIDSVLKTQNILGGYGVQWNSSACEDIDSIDLLFRFSRLTNYRQDEIQLSLKRAFPAILYNLNGDGGWVFRRYEAAKIGHSEMFSKINESSLFHTWFRILGMAYCLMGMHNVPRGYEYSWNIQHSPGHQLL